MQIELCSSVSGENNKACCIIIQFLIEYYNYCINPTNELFFEHI